MTDSVHPIRSNINFSELSHFSDWYELEKSKRFFVLFGGASSGKSRFVSTKFAFWFVTLKDVRFLIARKTTPSLRKSVYFEIKHILNEWGIDYEENKATMALHYKDNEMLFTGIDDPEKIKSVELNYAYMEEATEFDHADVLQVNLRLRRRNKNKGESNKLFLLYNPVSANSFLFTKYVNLARSGERTDVAYNHSTYQNNPYTDPAYAQQLLDYEKIDYNYYRIYTLGEPGVLNGLIYENWKICSDMQLNVFNTDPVGIGMDWGYNNPAAACGVWHYDGEIYLKELLYQRKLTQSDIIAKIVNSGEFNTDATYYCDSAEPDRIEDMRRHGLRAVPANKNVLQGINLAKSFRIWVHPESDNLIEELRNYKWKDSKVTDEFLDEPVKAFDHCLSGDTLISTPFGPTPLCELSKGDRVLTGNGSYQRVLWVGVTNPEASVVNLKFSDGSSITGTPDHLVYTLNRGWANLGSLSIFDELVSDSCKSVRPSNRRWDYSTLPDPIPVYNMHVENNHNYYANGILVHNCADAFRYVLSTSPLNRSVVPAKYATAQRGDEGIYSGYDSRFPLKINKPNIRRIPGL